MLELLDPPIPSEQWVRQPRGNQPPCTQQPGACDQQYSLSLTIMGVLFSIPLAGVAGSVASSCLAGLAFCFTSTAGMCSGRADEAILNLSSAKRPCSSSRVIAIHRLRRALGLQYAHALFQALGTLMLYPSRLYSA